MGRLVVLMVTAFVDMVGLAMIVPLLPFYATSFGATSTVVGVLVSGFSAAQLVTAPLWGRYSDRYGRRPAILTGLLVSAAAYLVFGLADTLWLLFAARLVQGAGAGTVAVVQAYVADASDPEERAKALGWLSAATSLGAVAGPALGSALANAWGRSAPGIGSAALCVLVSVFAWRFLRESHDLEAHARAGPATPSAAALRRIATHAGEPASRLVWVYTIAIGAFYGMIPTAPLLLADRLHVTAESVGYFIMYLGAIGVVVRTGLLGMLVRRFGEVQLARMGLVLLAAGLALLGSTHSFAMLFLSFTLMPLGTAFTFPCVTSLLSSAVPRHERGLYLGVQQAYGGLSRVLFPIGAGWAMDHLGLGVPFWMAAVLVAAVLVVALPARGLAPATVATGS